MGKTSRLSVTRSPPETHVFLRLQSAMGVAKTVVRRAHVCIQTTNRKPRAAAFRIGGGLPGKEKAFHDDAVRPSVESTTSAMFEAGCMKTKAEVFQLYGAKRRQRRSEVEYSVRMAFRQKRSAKEITRLMPCVSHRPKRVSAAAPTSPSSYGADYGRPGDLQSIGTRRHAKYPPPAPLFHWVASQCHIRRKLSWPGFRWSGQSFPIQV